MPKKLKEFEVVREKQAELRAKVEKSALPKGQKNYLVGQIGPQTATNLPTVKQQEKFVKLEQLEQTIDEKVAKAAKKTAKAAAPPLKGGNTNEPVVQKKNGLGDEVAKAANGNVKQLPPEPAVSLSLAERRHLVGRIGHSYARLGFYCPDLDTNAKMNTLDAMSDEDLVSEGARVDQLIRANDIPFPSERDVTDAVLILVCPGVADKLPAEYKELRPEAGETVDQYANNIRHGLRRWRAEEVEKLLQRLRQIKKEVEEKENKKMNANATTDPKKVAPAIGNEPMLATRTPPAAAARPNLWARWSRDSKVLVGITAFCTLVAIVAGITFVANTMSIVQSGQSGTKTEPKAKVAAAQQQPVEKPVVPAQVEQPPAKEPAVEQPAPPTELELARKKLAQLRARQEERKKQEPKSK